MKQTLTMLGLFIVSVQLNARTMETRVHSRDTGKTHDLKLTRTFDAPVEKVWNAWTVSEEVKKWWGPNGFTAPVAKMDVRVGGSSLVCMTATGMPEMYNTWTYEKIVPQKYLEFMLHFTDKDGNKFDPAKIGMPPGIPFAVRHVITFKSLGENKSELTVQEFGYATEEMVNISKSGLIECLDKMAATF